MSLYDSADEIGKQVQRKLRANRMAKQATEQAKQKLVADQKRHENAKRQGMI